MFFEEKEKMLKGHLKREFKIIFAANMRFFISKMHFSLRQMYRTELQKSTAAPRPAAGASAASGRAAAHVAGRAGCAGRAAGAGARGTGRWKGTGLLNTAQYSDRINRI